MIVYLHGFCSSPQSAKARRFGVWMGERGRHHELVCPALDPDPERAIAQAESAIRRAGASPTLVGISLGGYYAIHLAEKHGLRAALINPALPPHLETVPLVGSHRNFHSGAPFDFTTGHLATLRALWPAKLDPDRYLLLLETGDEVLDPAVTRRVLRGVPACVVEGGDHSFTHFDDFLPALVDFADSRPLPVPTTRL